MSNGDPNGNRTRVLAVKGRRPRPLDDGAARQGGAPVRRAARTGQASAASSRCISAALPPFHSSRLIVPASHQRWSAGEASRAWPSSVVGAPEGDPLEALAVVAAGDAADMAVADDAGLDQPRRPGCDARLRPARAIGTRRVERIAQRGRRRRPAPAARRAAARGRRATARRRRPAAHGGRRAAASIPPGATVRPAAIAWPPPAISRPLSLAASTAAPRSTPADRAARALAGAVLASRR